MYLFSVIVPVYNGENFIGRCIESMQRQNCKDWECIFVDDGSTDDSYEILSIILRTHEKLETSLRTGTVFHVSFFIC